MFLLTQAQKLLVLYFSFHSLIFNIKAMSKSCSALLAKYAPNAVTPPYLHHTATRASTTIVLCLNSLPSFLITLPASFLVPYSLLSK